MIDYQTYCQIRHLFVEKRLGLRQIARQLKLGLNTVRKWARRQSYPEATLRLPHSLPKASPKSESSGAGTLGALAFHRKERRTQRCSLAFRRV